MQNGLYKKSQKRFNQISQRDENRYRFGNGATKEISPMVLESYGAGYFMNKGNLINEQVGSEFKGHHVIQEKQILVLPMMAMEIESCLL